MESKVTEDFCATFTVYRIEELEDVARHVSCNNPNTWALCSEAAQMYADDGAAEDPALHVLRRAEGGFYLRAETQQARLHTQLSQCYLHGSRGIHGIKLVFFNGWTLTEIERVARAFAKALHRRLQATTPRVGIDIHIVKEISVGFGTDLDDLL